MYGLLLLPMLMGNIFEWFKKEYKDKSLENKNYSISIKYIKILYIKQFVKMLWDNVLNNKTYNEEVVGALITYTEYIVKQCEYNYNEVFDILESKDEIKNYLEKIEGIKEIDKSVEAIYSMVDREIYNFIKQIEKDYE